MATQAIRRTYEYRSAKTATIWVFIAIAAIVSMVVLYNQISLRAEMAQNNISAQFAEMETQQPVVQHPACYNADKPVYDNVLCIVPTATAN